MKYNPRWNRKGKVISDLVLRTDKGIVARRSFLSEDGFDVALAALIKRRDRWLETDEFRGKHLALAVVEHELWT